MNRSQRREKNRTINRYVEETKARVEEFGITADSGIGVVVICECRQKFAVGHIPVPVYSKLAAEAAIGKKIEVPAGVTESEWVIVLCPQCQRKHALRATITVRVEEEILEPIDLSPLVGVQ